MRLTPYRRVLSLPGVRGLLLLGLLTRIPATAIGLGLTLHVVNNLHRSYTAAGLVTAAYTIGVAVGAPVIGRLIDRRGARPALALTTLAQTTCWVIAPQVGYQALLVVALSAGLLSVPVWGIIRQSLAARVPEAQRRPAFALDSMSVELSFMIGPAAAVALSTAAPDIALEIIAAALLVAGLALFVANPVTGTGPDAEEPHAPSRRTWLRLPVVAVMMAICTSTFILSATELTIVATLRQDGTPGLTSVVFPMWCAYSLLGGLVFGTLHRPVPLLAMVAAMGLLTIPVGLATNWWVLLLVLLPSGVLCAPTLTVGNDTLSRLVPVKARGEAMGLLGTALTGGASLGSPFAGLVIDHAGPGWSYAAAGAVGTLGALLSLPASRQPSSAARTCPEPVTAEV